MPNTVLVAPADTRLGTALTALLRGAGARVIAAVGPEAEENGEEKEPEDNSESLLELPWNRRSMLSARNIILEGLNTYGEIDQAFILHSTKADSHPLHELPPVSIEAAVDASTKSVLFFIKELLQYFLRTQQGAFSLLLYERSGTPRTPLAAAAAAGFRAVVGSLLATYQNEHFSINGFVSHNEEPEAFAEFTIQTLAGKAGQATGKWFRQSAGPLHALARSNR